jgi:hypothetical protein
MNARLPADESLCQLDIGPRTSRTTRGGVTSARQNLIGGWANPNGLPSALAGIDQFVVVTFR